MSVSKRERELWVAGRVADAINSNESADYHAELGSDPPDALLVSATGVFPEFQLEVVSLPIEDFTAREDNQNVLNFKEQLHRELEQDAFQVSVHLLERGKRHGVPTGVVKKLVPIIRETMTQTTGINPTFVDFEQMYDEYPDIAEYVSEISLIRFRHRQSVSVEVPLATFGPRDASWLVAAAAKKDLLGKATHSRLIVAIDGSWLVDAEQIQAFKSLPQVSNLPFSQLWLVTTFHGVIRMK